MSEVMESDFICATPRHVAIIMDGNGRWAQRRMLPRSHGHKAGVDALKIAVRAARELGVQYLTLFSFSSENWSRPEGEINELFALLRLFIRRDLAELHKNNVRVRIIGSRYRLPSDVLSLLVEAEKLTRNNDAQTLIIAFNYGSRDEIVRAVKLIAAKVDNGELCAEEITPELISNHLDTADIPDPDMIIRTSGEKRLSNFLMWQSAYSELVFVDCLWPEFDKTAFSQCLDEYANRTRKFGGLVKDTGS
ncbi:MAG: isoprenyl transferase [Rhizobiaceae bacterium]|nr:isoprenyl transferase [Rhizobiaceae bacterium]